MRPNRLIVISILSVTSSCIAQAALKHPVGVVDMRASGGIESMPIGKAHLYPEMDLNQIHAKLQYIDENNQDQFFPSPAVSDITQAAADIMQGGSPAVAGLEEGHLAIMPLFPDSGSHHAIVTTMSREGPGQIRRVPLTGQIAGHLQDYVRKLNPADVDQALRRAFDAVRSYEHTDGAIPETVFTKAEPEPLDLYAEMQKRWIRDDEYYYLIDKHLAQPSSYGRYIGQLPKEMADLFPNRTLATVLIDAAAQDLLSHRQWGLWTKPKSPEEVSRAISPLKVSYISRRDNAEVYKLETDQHAWAMKLYRNAKVQDEFRALTFFTAKGARDIMKSVLARFSDKPSSHDEVTWILSEFIPNSRPLSPSEWRARGPSSMAKIARENHISIEYAHNRVRGILVGAGFIQAVADNPAAYKEGFSDGIVNSRFALHAAMKKWREQRRNTDTGQTTR